jgi:GNAT superfamily N-acetyltransferase
MPNAMKPGARPSSAREVLPLRTRYRAEMKGQIVYDSIHRREGWTSSFVLELDGAAVGFGSVASGGPWKDRPTVIEFYVLPEHRTMLFALFEAFLAASGARFFETQTDDTLLTVMAHTYGRDIASEKWLLELEGAVVASGGLLFHYNRPYGDLHMEVAEPFRRRGLGTYLVQELKRACYQLGAIPCARCDPANVASRRTLQRAGLVPFAHVLRGAIGG